MGDMPMGMADGGLAMLPIPETMFGEPMDGSYADGGIVSFADGGPTNYYGMSTDLGANLGMLQDRLTPETEFTERESQYIRDTLSPEAQKKRSKQDLNSFLMEFGAKLASTRGPLLSAAGEAASATLPGLQEAAKARRAEQREAISVGAQRELGRNKEQRELLSTGLGMVEKAGGFAEAAKTREFQDKWNRMDDKTRRDLGYLTANTQLQVARERTAGIADYQAKQLGLFRNLAIPQANKVAQDQLKTNMAYRRLAGSKDSENQKKALEMFTALRNSIADGMVAQRLGGVSDNAYEGFSSEEIGGE
jgi:hypothetical protein